MLSYIINFLFGRFLSPAKYSRDEIFIRKFLRKSSGKKVIWTYCLHKETYWLLIITFSHRQRPAFSCWQEILMSSTGGNYCFIILCCSDHGWYNNIYQSQMSTIATGSQVVAADLRSLSISELSNAGVEHHLEWVTIIQALFKTANSLKYKIYFCYQPNTQWRGKRSISILKTLHVPLWRQTHYNKNNGSFTKHNPETLIMRDGVLWVGVRRVRFPHLEAV